MGSNMDARRGLGQRKTAGRGAPQSFLDLTPDRILDAVESAGQSASELRCTGRCLQLNSMENRVFEVEIEVEDESTITSPSDRFRVIKFYRPGRWTTEQILEEHRFLTDLAEEEIPVVAPIPFADGCTLKVIAIASQAAAESGTTPEEHRFAVFPKQGGRAPDELAPGYAQRIGRLLARVHAVGARREAPNRLRLSPEVYGTKNLKFLLESSNLPPELERRFEDVVSEICDISSPLFGSAKFQRIHGDCHFGNLLWGREGPFLVDFDDMVTGPCVQDLWLLLPGVDAEARAVLEVMIEGYEELREFDRFSLRLIEPLRALRMVHYAAWIARRWSDPAFPRSFPHFGTHEYWRGLTGDLIDQLAIIKAEMQGELRWG